MISLERSPPPTRSLLSIERAQGWSMLAYYPLEHLYYLAVHNIVPPTIPVPGFMRPPALPASADISTEKAALHATKLLSGLD